MSGGAWVDRLARDTLAALRKGKQDEEADNAVGRASTALSMLGEAWRRDFGSLLRALGATDDELARVGLRPSRPASHCPGS